MSLVRCARCNAPTLLASSQGGDEVQTCPACKKVNHLRAFAALTAPSVRDRPPQLPEDPSGDGEASCFYSPGRRATAECGHCGVLISNPWSAAWGSKTVCLKCLDHLRADVKNHDFQSKRVLWDNTVLGLALLPLTVFFYWTAFVTAPTAAFLGFWHWNSPRSLVPRGKWRLVLGMLLALAQVGLIVTAIGMMVYGLSI